MANRGLYNIPKIDPGKKGGLIIRGDPGGIGTWRKDPESSNYLLERYKPSTAVKKPTTGSYEWAMGRYNKVAENHAAKVAKAASIRKFATHYGLSQSELDAQLRKNNVYDLGDFDPSELPADILKKGKTRPYKVGTVKEFKVGGKIETKVYEGDGKWSKPVATGPRWDTGGESTTMSKNIEYLVKSGLAPNRNEAFDMVKTSTTMSRSQFLMQYRTRLSKPDFMGDMPPAEVVDDLVEGAATWYDKTFGSKSKGTGELPPFPDDLEMKPSPAAGYSPVPSWERGGAPAGTTRTVEELSDEEIMERIRRGR